MRNTDFVALYLLLPPCFALTAVAFVVAPLVGNPNADLYRGATALFDAFIFIVWRLTR